MSARKTLLPESQSVLTDFGPLGLAREGAGVLSYIAGRYGMLMPPDDRLDLVRERQNFSDATTAWSSARCVVTHRVGPTFFISSAPQRNLFTNSADCPERPTRCGVEVPSSTQHKIKQYQNHCNLQVQNSCQQRRPPHQLSRALSRAQALLLAP